MLTAKQPKILARLGAENAEEKIEVVVNNQSAGLLEIRSLRWGRGIGWYVQKTITLGPTQAKMLGFALRRSTAARAKKNATGNVIPFPAR